jgi:hypothetical protein
MKAPATRRGDLELCPSCKRPSALGECTLVEHRSNAERNGWPEEHGVTCSGPDPSWKMLPRFLLEGKTEGGSR